MKLDTLIDGHQRKCRVQAKVPEHLSIRPSGRLELSPLLILWMHMLFFFMIFTFFVENSLLGNTKLSFLVLWFKSDRPCRERALHFSLFLHPICPAICPTSYLPYLYSGCTHYFFHDFYCFVENHLLENTKLSFLVSWFKSYWPCRQRALYFSLCLDSLLTRNVSKVYKFPGIDVD